MPRPRTRTAAATAAEAQEVRRLFGTVTNAFQRLMPGGAPLTWAVFRLAAGGHPVVPRDLAAFRARLAEWKRATLK